MCHHVQRKLSTDRCQPSPPKPIQSLLTTQAAEHRLHDRLALAEDAAGLRMLHHHAKRFPLFILRIALDAPALGCLCTFRAQRAIATGACSIDPVFPRVHGFSGARFQCQDLASRTAIRVSLRVVFKGTLMKQACFCGLPGMASSHREQASLRLQNHRSTLHRVALLWPESP